MLGHVTFSTNPDSVEVEIVGCDLEEAVPDSPEVLDAYDFMFYEEKIGVRTYRSDTGETTAMVTTLIGTSKAPFSELIDTLGSLFGKKFAKFCKRHASVLSANRQTNLFPPDRVIDYTFSVQEIANAVHQIAENCNNPTFSGYDEESCQTLIFA
jgi:hypothetical protein